MKEFTILVPTDLIQHFENACKSLNLKVSFGNGNKFNTQATVFHRNSLQSVDFDTIFRLGRLFENMILNEIN